MPVEMTRLETIIKERQERESRPPMETASVEPKAIEKPAIEVRRLSAYFGGFRAIKDISLQAYEKKVTAFIGPSGCGKSTFIRCFNRMHEVTPGARTEGEILIHGDDILKKDPVLLRRSVGM